MNKTKVISIIILAGLAGTAAAFYFWKKNKTNTTNDNTSDNTDIEVEDDIIDIETEVDIAVDDMDSNIQSFMEYLMKNGISMEEAASVCETIIKIKEELPDIFPDVNKRMLDMMASEFSIDKSHEFDRENFRIMYSSIDPCQLIAKNGFKIIPMGSDYYDAMTDLAEALAELQENDPDEAMTAIYEIYHIFNSLDIEAIDDSTYVENFKVYVDRYVMAKDNDSNDDELIVSNAMEVDTPKKASVKSNRKNAEESNNVILGNNKISFKEVEDDVTKEEK